MLFDFDNEKLPNVYLRNNKEYYLDSIRKKLILVTPEETVRQKWISFLKEKLFIPECLISVEEHLSHYGIQSNRRVDIIIKGSDYQGNAYPLCIVECKAPDVPITERTQNQVFDYCNMIGADYAIITNGYIWRLDDSKVIGLVANLISYALIRDEYRKFKKAK